jgi:hypothetical protein
MVNNRTLGVLKGPYSREFLERMGYKEFVPPVVEVCHGSVMPLEPVKLAYEFVKLRTVPMSDEKLLIMASFEISVEPRGRDDVLSALEKCREDMLKSICVERATLRIEEL